MTRNTTTFSNRLALGLSNEALLTHWLDGRGHLALSVADMIPARRKGGPALRHEGTISVLQDILVLHDMPGASADGYHARWMLTKLFAPDREGFASPVALRLLGESLPVMGITASFIECKCKQSLGELHRLNDLKTNCIDLDYYESYRRVSQLSEIPTNLSAILRVPTYGFDPGAYLLALDRLAELLATGDDRKAHIWGNAGRDKHSECVFSAFTYWHQIASLEDLLPVKETNDDNDDHIY